MLCNAEWKKNVCKEEIGHDGCHCDYLTDACWIDREPGVMGALARSVTRSMVDTSKLVVGLTKHGLLTAEVKTVGKAVWFRENRRNKKLVDLYRATGEV